MKSCCSFRREVLYNILIGFSIPVKPDRLIKMCAGDIYSKVKKGKNLFSIFPIQIGLKQVIAFRALLSNFSVEYIFTNAQERKEGMELNYAYQCLFCGADVNLLDENKYCK
jgi:hypothetical protein